MHDERQLLKSIVHNTKPVHSHQASFEPGVKLTVIEPLNDPKTGGHDRISKWVCEILSRFSSNSSKHSLNATRSSCFSNVPKNPISLLKLTRKSHRGKDFVSRTAFYH